jgi:hypothetical protein
VTTGEGDITVIDATGSAVSLPLAGNPVAVATNPTTSRAYVANSFGNNVAVIGWPLGSSHLLTAPVVSLKAGATAKLCAVSVQRLPVSIFMGLRKAGGFNLLASKQATLSPGAGDCLNFSWPPQFDQDPQFDRNIVGFVVSQGRLNDQGEIVQNQADSDGDIVASLQIQLPGRNNAPPQTFLYVPLEKACEHHGRRDRD